MYWRGQTRATFSTKIRKNVSRLPVKKLTYKDELLLTLMRLRLGILNEDLADRFGFYPTTCSTRYKTWIRLLRILLGDAIRDHLPNIYRKAGHQNLRCIINYTELFVEHPKALDLQAQTWSDYKSYNTIKFLIGISPNGYITFLSDFLKKKLLSLFIVGVTSKD